MKLLEKYLKEKELQAKLKSNKSNIIDSYKQAYRDEQNYTRLQKEDYESMIDLALMTGDEAWFMELTEQLKEVAI